MSDKKLSELQGKEERSGKLGGDEKSVNSLVEITAEPPKSELFSLCAFY